MNNKSTNPPAFPTLYFHDVSRTLRPDDPGMTLRDYFAAKAMQGWISGAPKIHGVAINGTAEHAKSIAESAYRYADAMLKARNSTLAHE